MQTAGEASQISPAGFLVSGQPDGAEGLDYPPSRPQVREPHSVAAMMTSEPPPPRLSPSLAFRSFAFFILPYNSPCLNALTALRGHAGAADTPEPKVPRSVAIVPQALENDGDPGWIRTNDLVLRRHLL